MEGVQSFEQRSQSEFKSGGNRVIIVNRREPVLDWQTTSDSSSRVDRPGGVGVSLKSILSSLCLCCPTCTKEATTSDKSVKRKRRLSEASAISAAAQISSEQTSFDFGPFPSNVWKTSKYTMMNFLPKNLFEQFRRLANFYFLITAIVQVIIPFSPIGPSTSLIPLAFVISTTAIKQAYEDYLRHKLDNEVNYRMCNVLRANKKLESVRSKDIRVGDIVYVKNNEEVPCDMILLASSGNADRCYITTANLDGETSLKGRTCFQVHHQVGDIEKIDDTMLVVECEKPNATLYEFNGFLRAPKDQAAQDRLLSDLKQLEELRNSSRGKSSSKSSTSQSKRLAIISAIFKRMKQTSLRAKINKNLTTEQLKSIGAEYLVESRSDHIEIPLDVSNLLLRASRLRNTRFIYGLAIYTGPDTRLANNSHVKPNKFSSLESRVNMFLGIAFLMLLMLTFVSSIRYKRPSEWYLRDIEKADSFTQILMAHFVLYNYLVPISLYVTLEFVKFLGTISVLDDKKLQADVLNTVTQTRSERAGAGSAGKKHDKQHVKQLVGPQCNSSDLNEDLGQVEVLFSDKTGTLTENRMLFMACSIDGRLFRSIAGDLYEQPDGLCYMPKINVARKLFCVSVNRYGALASDLAQVASPHSVGSQASGNRSSRSHSNKLAKLPQRERPFDHRVRPDLRDLRHVSANIEQHERVVEFLLALCLCSTITLNEQTPLEDCLPNKMERYDYQSASPDEESLISAAAHYGVIVCKSSERECFIAIRRSPGLKSQSSSKQHKQPNQQQQQQQQQQQLKHHIEAPKKGVFKSIVETKNSTERYIIRQFERMMTLEFNSVRKKMSVLYRDCDNECLILFTKGSESVLDCIGPTKSASLATMSLKQLNNNSFKSPAHSKSPTVGGGGGGGGGHAHIPQEQVINKTLAHFEAFSKSGLRTMLAAKRQIDQDAYENIKTELHDIRLLSLPDNREMRMAQLYKRVESNMKLIGATAVEDSLQDGVPETIENLKEAGIKVWLLTGDKVETAISVAYLCKLLDRNMNLLHLVRQQDFDACKDSLDAFAQRIKTALLFGDDDEFNQAPPPLMDLKRETVSKRPQPHHHHHAQKQSTPKKTITTSFKKNVGMTLANNTETDDAPRFALIADGRSLHYAMKHAREQLEFVSTNCVCVLGCRLSPLQKAEIVEMIKHGSDRPITAAIGDGANDVSMIQEAHVGIGISGKEGRQAVNSSDFAINRFYMVKRLFFVHGHLFYFRTASTIHYFFYKNLLFIMPQFLYSFYNLSSATSLYHPIMLISFNMIFTSVPILLFGLSERNIPEDLLEHFPRLYRINYKNRLMRYPAFLAWLLMGALQAIICFYFIQLIWGSHTPFLESGKMSGTIGFASILFTTLVLGITFKLYFISKNRTYAFDIAAILSCLAIPILILICSLFDMSKLFDENTLYRQFLALVGSPAYWLAIFTTTAAMVVPEVIMYVREQVQYHKMLNAVIYLVRHQPTCSELSQAATTKALKIAEKNRQDGTQPKRNRKRSLTRKNGKPKDKDKDKDRDKDRDKNRDDTKEDTKDRNKDKDKDDNSVSSKKEPGYTDIIGSLVAGKFKLTKLLGSGSYGAVYLGKNVVTSEQVAVKLEHKSTRAAQLPLEYRFIKMIGPVEGFPRIIRIDDCAGTYHAMIMELLGPSLEDVFNACERRMSLKSVIFLTLQLISRFQTLHSKNIIYRDVKPENFLLGRQASEKENIVHIIDYGLAKEYIDPATGTHIAFRGQRGAIGTARYMSVNTHMGKEQSRRDDLEALGYVIIYFMRGTLPWQGLPATDHRDRMRKIGEMKRRLAVEEICDRCPTEFASYLRYVKELDFYEAPDYDYLKRLFQDLFLQNRFIEDGVYDWTGKFDTKSNS